MNNKRNRYSGHWVSSHYEGNKIIGEQRRFCEQGFSQKGPTHLHADLRHINNDDQSYSFGINKNIDTFSNADLNINLEFRYSLSFGKLW